MSEHEQSRRVREEQRVWLSATGLWDRLHGQARHTRAGELRSGTPVLDRLLRRELSETDERRLSER